MKQKCQLQMGIAQYKNAETALRARGTDTTHRNVQSNEICNLGLAQGVQSYQPSNSLIHSFHSNTDFTFLL